MKALKIIAFTIKNSALDAIGGLVIDPQERSARLSSLKAVFAIDELFYIATCNRVEFVLSSTDTIDEAFVKRFVRFLYPHFNAAQVDLYGCQAECYQHEQALVHLMRVACSLEALVVGEKEILAQVRTDYEACYEWGLTGDFFRMIMNRVVKTSKEVYTRTKIADKPVSVASLAARALNDYGVKDDARFIIIGAGETIQLVTKYLQKHSLRRAVIFNRSLENGEQLAQELGAKAFPLHALKEYDAGFDVIITCTGATTPILTSAVYESLLQGSTERKVIVDLAIPNDTHPEVIQDFQPHFISLEQIQTIAAQNLEQRRGELVHAEQIIEENLEEFHPLLHERRVELAMSSVPKKMKEIKVNAIEKVFANEINALDAESRALLDKVLNYMEKRCISVPMVMAKEILMNHR